MDPESASLARRRVVVAAPLAGLAALAGCSSYGQTTASPAYGDDPPAAAAKASSKASPKAKKSKPLAAAADIPVGGGKVFEAKKVVVTQPTEGEFKAFSAVCTHQGCTVGSVSNGTIVCPCHGSRFNITDGSVDTGPAQQPLPARKIKVQDGDLLLG